MTGKTTGSQRSRAWCGHKTPEQMRRAHDSSRSREHLNTQQQQRRAARITLPTVGILRDREAGRG